jgi:hypothetical protein
VDVYKAERALEQIAKKNHVSVATVRHEIEIAIAAASKNTDPKIQAFWKSVPHKREYPTPEEVIAYIADMTKN